MPRVNTAPGLINKTPGTKLFNGRGNRKQKVTAVLRDLDVIKLRELGCNYEEIADQMTNAGHTMGPVTARNIVRRILQNTIDNNSESISEVRALELRRLDRLERVVNAIVERKGKPFVKLAAVDRVLKIGDQRAKIHGLHVKKLEINETQTVRVYHGVEPAPEAVKLLEESNPIDAEFEDITSED